MLTHYIRQGTKIAVIELNAAKSRNALSFAMLDQLQKTLHLFLNNPDVRVVVLAHQGPVFSSGHDLKDLQEMVRTQDREAVLRLFQKCSETMQTIVRSTKPCIAKVDGVATAAGCQLVASCDLAYASKTSRFATPGVNIGLFCSTPAVALARAVQTKHVAEMLLTGDFISADKAERIGLINAAVPGDDLEELVFGVASRIASKSPQSIAMGKPAFYKQLQLPLEDAYQYATKVMVENSMQDDCCEGIDAFLKKRRPSWSSGWMNE